MMSFAFPSPGHQAAIAAGGVMHAAKDFWMNGPVNTGAWTLSDAEAGVPTMLSLELIAPVVLFFTPWLVPLTLTPNVHEPFAGNAAPLKLIVPLPAVAGIVPPAHEPVRPFGGAPTAPAGNGWGN